MDLHRFTVFLLIFRQTDEGNRGKDDKDDDWPRLPYRIANRE